MILLLDKLLLLFGHVPHLSHYHRKIRYQYVSKATYPDFIRVYHNEKHLFSYLWIDGEEAPLHSNLWF